MAGEVSANAGRIPKPVLRGLHRTQTKRHLAVVGALITVTALTIKYGYNEKQKQDYANFYKTYDDEAVFKRIKDAGLFQYVK